MPDFPVRNPCVNASHPVPLGDTTQMPVITGGLLEGAGMTAPCKTLHHRTPRPTRAHRPPPYNPPAAAIIPSSWPLSCSAGFRQVVARQEFPADLDDGAGDEAVQLVQRPRRWARAKSSAVQMPGRRRVLCL